MRNRLFFKPGDIVDIRQIRASEVALKRSGLFESQSGPGQRRRKSPSTPPTATTAIRKTTTNSKWPSKPQRRPPLRRRVPRPEPRRRLARSRIGPDARLRALHRPARRPACSARRKPGRRPEPTASGSGSAVSSASSDLVEQAQEYAEALARARRSSDRRLQYLAPDDGWQGRPLPHNSAPGDSASYPGKGDSPIFADAKIGTVPCSDGSRSHPTASRNERGSQSEGARILASSRRKAAAERQPRDRVILTQYTTATSRANPASNEQFALVGPFGSGRGERRQYCSAGFRSRAGRLPRPRRRLASIRRPRRPRR